jgi:Zn-dependent protease
MATTVFLSVLAAWIGSVMIHEYAHARVALAGGDTSVIEKGYLSMNPLRYLHPVTSFLIPIAIMALGGIPLPGGAVWIDTSRLRSRHWNSAVSAAGPLSNLLLLVICASPFYLGLRDPAADSGGAGWMILAFFCYIQCFAVIINLLPIPGIDGWGIIEPYMKREVQMRAREFGNYGLLILLAIFFIDNPIGDGIRDLAFSLIDGLQIPLDLVRDGFHAFTSVLKG